MTILFKNAPDLLDEFMQFLPDTSSGAAAPQGSLFGGLIGQMTGQAPAAGSAPAAGGAGGAAEAGAGAGAREKQKQRAEKKEREPKKDAAGGAGAGGAAADKQKKRPLGADKDVAKQGSSKVRPCLLRLAV